MNSFDQKLIENPLFLKWIFNTNPYVDFYWEQYMIENSEDKNQILELKQHLSELKFTNDMLRHFEKEELTNRIKARINRNLKKTDLQLRLNSLMKYAAVALIFTAIGGWAVYFNMRKDNIYEEFAQQTIPVPPTAQGSLLITSNGENVALKKTNSTVDYSRSGTIVLDNDSVLGTAEDAPNVMNQLVIPYGNQSKVVLSDKTVVWLNAGSRLVYPTLFREKNREVLLFGEAYFEVAKNPGKPFIVKTSGIDIRVIGTKFNVSAYNEDNVIQTVLKEGTVSIRRKDANLFEKDIVIKTNQLASFNKNSRNTEVHEVNAGTYSLWTKGLISFEDIDFSRVIKQVERYYNISISFSEPQKEIMRISGKLDLKRSRKEVMEYLEKVSLSSFEQVQEGKYTIK